MKIIAFHEYNDFSGSPTVLRTVLEGLAKRGHSVEVVTSQGGVLDELKELPNVRFHKIGYKYSKHKAMTGLRTLIAQSRAFFLGLARGKNAVFYANTVLSAGGAFAGHLMHMPVVYHYHENAHRKSRFYAHCAGLMQRIADEIICVSESQRKSLSRRHGITVIANGIPRSLAAEVKPDIESAFERRNVLMGAALKGYKGVPAFIELARITPELQFTLALNETPEIVKEWMERNNIPANLSVHPRTHRMADLYNQATAVVNMSNPDNVLESFGMTVIEGFAGALPAVVPDEGGIAELIEDGVNGYHADVRRPEEVRRLLLEMTADCDRYRQLAEGALRSAAKYSADRQTAAVEALLKSLPDVTE